MIEIDKDSPSLAFLAVGEFFVRGDLYVCKEKGMEAV